MRRAVTAVASCVLVLGACSTGGGPGDTAASPGPSPTTSPGDDLDLPDLSGEQIEVAAVWTGAEAESFQAVIDEFAALTGAEVTYTPTGDDVDAVLGTRLQGGEGPDVALLPNPGLLLTYVARGHAQPFDDGTAETVAENFDSRWRELATVDGELYGLFFKVANKSLVWFNAAVLEDAGVEPPESWDDLVAAVDTVSESGPAGLSIGASEGWTLTDLFENVLLQSAGADYYDRLARHEASWTDDEVREALDEMLRILGPEDVPEDAIQLSFPDSVNLLFRDPPEAGFIPGADFIGGVIEGEGEAEIGDDADYVPFPAMGDSEPGERVIGGGDVAVLLRDSDGGRAFIRFLATPEAASLWASEGGFLSANRNLDTETYPDEHTRGFAEMLMEADTFRFDLSDLQPPGFGATPAMGLFRGLQDVFTDPERMDDILAELEEEAKRAYDESFATQSSPAGGAGGPSPDSTD